MAQYRVLSHYWKYRVRRQVQLLNSGHHKAIIGITVMVSAKLGSYKPVYNCQFSKYNTYQQRSNRLYSIIIIIKVYLFLINHQWKIFLRHRISIIKQYWNWSSGIEICIFWDQYHSSLYSVLNYFWLIINEKVCQLSVTVVIYMWQK